MKNSVGFDVEVLTDKTMEMLGVAPGQVIWIWANVISMDFIEALAFRIRARGAYWGLRLNSEPLLRLIGSDDPMEYLGLVPEHELRWLDDMDPIVEVRDHGGYIPGISVERRRAMGAEWIALIDEAALKGVRRVIVINPTPALAAAFGLLPDDLQCRLMRAVYADYAVIDGLQEQIARLLDEASDVHITCPAGTDLRLRVTGRKARVDTDSLPHGEAYNAPLEESAEGVAVIEKAFFRGKFAAGLRLIFSGGRVTGAEAPDPAERRPSGTCWLLPAGIKM